MKDLRCNKINEKGYKCNARILSYEGNLTGSIEVACKKCRTLYKLKDGNFIKK